MLAFGTLLVLSFGAVAHGAPRIVGGNDAPNHKYPFMVIVRNVKKDQVCSGTILNENWILTSAVCAKSVVNSTTITAGTNILTEQGYNYSAKIVLINENFGHLHDNIALIRVVGAINFNDFVKPVILPKDNLEDYNHKAVLTGWGSTKNGNPPSNTLQEVDLDVLTSAECESKEDDYNPDKICTSTNNGTGFCYDDWGSPLLVDGIQVGIVAYMTGDCITGYPNVFTRVWSYKDWIERIMDKYGPVDPSPTSSPPPASSSPSPPLNDTIHFHLNLSLSIDGTLTFGKNPLAGLT